MESSTRSTLADKWPLHGAAQARRHRPGLHEGEVGAGKHRLGLFEGVDLASARLLPRVVVADQPIALQVQVSDALGLLVRLPDGALVLDAILLQLCLELCLRALLIGD